MRILIPAFGFEDSFVDNVEETLVGMGHEVRKLGYVSHKKYWALPRYATRVSREMMVGDKPDRVDQKIIKLARDFRLDVILAITGLADSAVEVAGMRVPTLTVVSGYAWQDQAAKVVGIRDRTKNEAGISFAGN